MTNTDPCAELLDAIHALGTQIASNWSMDDPTSEYKLRRFWNMQDGLRIPAKIPSWRSRVSIDMLGRHGYFYVVEGGDVLDWNKKLFQDVDDYWKLYAFDMRTHMEGEVEKLLAKKSQATA